MSKHILITGGAGFIGSHLADHLLSRGYKVRALDNLSPQVHGPNAARPEYLDPEVELMVGDVRDPNAVRKALDGIDAVFHFAAAVGVGQSMYKIVDYTDINNIGTAVLLEALIQNPVERLVVASSMSLYGEGLYKAPDGTISESADRTIDCLKGGQWEVCNEKGEVLTPVPTPETKSPKISSIYALSKYDQEKMCLMVGQAYNIPTAAMRFFNVYGTRQALSNPYTGVLAIFASRFLNDNSPMIFEDGLQQRDFVSVYDIARACKLALESPNAPGNVFNVGSGQCFTVREVADRMARVLGKENIQPQITGTYRVGDIRHCFADITKARLVLGYEPSVTFETGLTELAGWLKEQEADDKVADAAAELQSRGLTV